MGRNGGPESWATRCVELNGPDVTPIPERRTWAPSAPVMPCWCGAHYFRVPAAWAFTGRAPVCGAAGCAPLPLGAA